MISCIDQNEKSDDIDKFNGTYGLKIVIGDNKEGKVDGIDGNMLYYYTIDVKGDTSRFVGVGHMTYFSDLCKNKIYGDTLYISYVKTIEGTDYNKAYQPIIKLYIKDTCYFIDSKAIYTGRNNKGIQIEKNK
ncbi:hypothetical protein BZG02_15905 [Labilibaculum filiforme]|uniref:Uncharacterized protein n=2 Tax=Labilibaculum filiforme TaxID=1940526 RepID=A0A2N3HTQ9_9BACT|nr:hypothetical protein BZG02_15905 [Labilibaculum filiforme]